MGKETEMWKADSELLLANGLYLPSLYPKALYNGLSFTHSSTYSICILMGELEATLGHFNMWTVGAEILTADTSVRQLVLTDEPQQSSWRKVNFADYLVFQSRQRWGLIARSLAETPEHLMLGSECVAGTERRKHNVIYCISDWSLAVTCGQTDWGITSGVH